MTGRFGWTRGLAVPLALLALAEGAAVAVNLQSDSLARPSDVARAIGGIVADGTVLRATTETLASAFGGLGIGCLIGLSLGVLFGLCPLINRLAELTVEVVRPVPSVALIPVAMLTFGFGYRMEITVVAFATMWPILILTRAAVAAIEPRLFDVARALRLAPWAWVVKIVLPATLPSIFVAVRLGVGIALILAITVEIAANPMGLGFAIMEAQQTLRPAEMYALLAWIGAIGWGLNALLVRTQDQLFRHLRAAGGAP